MMPAGIRATLLPSGRGKEGREVSKDCGEEMTGPGVCSRGRAEPRKGQRQEGTGQGETSCKCTREWREGRDRRRRERNAAKKPLGRAGMQP